MKDRYYLQLYLILILFIVSKQQKLELTTHETNRYQNSYRGWYDLLRFEVECPNRGIFKNFVLKKENNQYFYRYQCYSSVSQDIDYGEPIIKNLKLSTKYEWNYRSYDFGLNYLNGFSVDCWADYGLNYFQLYVKNGLNRYAFCHGIKPSYTSPLSIETEHKIGSIDSLDALVDVTVGSTAQENDVDIGYPLRGFKYVVDTSSSYSNPTIYYVYSYSKLRNMKVVLDSYKQRFEELRNSNTQKN